MNKKVYRTALIVILLAALTVLASIYFSHHTVAVMDPKGPIALQERNLFLLALGIMLIVVIPVFILTFYTVYKYRDGHRGKYKPDFDHSRILEATWWLIPGVIITILSVITWNATYNLNPYKPIDTKISSLNIEVVALNWKWLFIYPDQHVASVNSLVIPVNQPVTFYLTSEAPMNTFWIPQLSGQIMCMPGMSTQINMMATSIGSYYGSSGNISGTGFADMHFYARAVSTATFKNWVKTAGKGSLTLSHNQYNQLAKDSYNNPITYYKNPSSGIYLWVIEKYMPKGFNINAVTSMVTGM
ncbi:MAG: COX aromatic rich motif-containing protein [Candidatus Saccharimonadales bacterium]